MSTEQTIRLALLGPGDRAWKYDGLCARLSPSYACERLAVEDLGPSSVARLAAFDVVFHKAKDDATLDLLEAVEARGATRVINPTAAVRLSKHRPRVLDVLDAHDVPRARDFHGPLSRVPFDAFVVKGEFDDDLSVPFIVGDDAARARLLEAQGDAPVYAQAFIDTLWEFKIYGVGEALFAFRQRPILVNPDKLATREPFNAPPAMLEATRRALDAVGLEVGGVDFLGPLDHARVTDVNSTQGLQNFNRGYEALIRHFDRSLAR